MEICFKNKKDFGDGNYEIKRNICEIPFNGSYTRVKAHLLKILGAGVRVCPNITPSKLVELKKLDNEASLKIEKLDPLSHILHFEFFLPCSQQYPLTRVRYFAY